MSRLPYMHTDRKGRLAEILAAFYLQAKGYKILERRYKTRMGEIDLIAQKKNLLIIAEVKRRQSLTIAQESISHKSRQRISRAARIFLERNLKYESYGLRFDGLYVIGVRIHHAKDIWRA